MPPPDPSHEPTGRDWSSFWSLVCMQIIAAFNMNMSKFVLVPLGAWLAHRQPPEAFKGIEHTVAVLLVLPYVLFSPTAGWLADRFPKNRVILTTAVVQILLLVLLWMAIRAHVLMASLLMFFLLSTLSTLLSPAKMTVVKELVGGRRIGFASGVIEGTVILAILGGQIVGGKWFDHGLAKHDAWGAADRPILCLTALSLVALMFALAIRRTASHSVEKYSLAVATRHIRDLSEVFRDKLLRRCGFGVGFFWGFGGFICLTVLEVAERQHGGGGEGTGTAFANLWAMCVIGIAAGSISAGLICRRNIELGLSPIGGFIMTAATLALPFTRPEGPWMMAMLVLAGMGAAVFLVPQQAVVQDRPAQDRRGAVLSGSNLINNALGILAVAAQFGMRYLGVPVPWQFALLGGVGLIMTLLNLRAAPRDFVRVLGLAVIRTIYRIRPLHASRIPHESGALLLSNHLTFADAFFLTAACPRPVRFVMDAAFTRNPWIRRFTALFDTINISSRNPREAIRAAAAALQEGHILCVFPEGQISRTGTLRRINRGYQLIAGPEAIPLIPVWLDGAWRSIFSFERDRFIRKRPFPLHFPINAAFGKPIPREHFAPQDVQAALLETAATAIAERFREPRWSSRVPAHLSDRHDWPAPDPLRKTAAESAPLLGAPDLCRRLWINAYQIGQLNALPPRLPFACLDGDPALRELPSLLLAFPELFQTRAVRASMTSGGPPARWVGGAALRAALLAHPPQSPAVFFDFGPDALEPLDLPHLVHCPCLAAGGMVLAMSVPAPPLLLASNRPQPGAKPGSLGLLLPGFFIRRDHGTSSVHGPAAPDDGIPLPPSAYLDADGFLICESGFAPLP